MSTPADRLETVLTALEANNIALTASVTTCTTSAGAASSSANAALESAGDAGDSAESAGTSAGLAADKAEEASGSAGYSAEWANLAEDTLVSAAAGGDQIGDFSARHWAAKAAAIAAAMSIDVGDNNCTLTLKGNTADPSYTNDSGNSKYIELGNVLVLVGKLAWSGLTGGSGALKIGGLPSVLAASVPVGGALFGASGGLTWSGNLRLMADGGYARLRLVHAPDGGTNADLQVSALAGTGYLHFVYVGMKV